MIIEPVRSMLIPGFDDVKKRSVDAGALGGGISGSGPSIFMLCEKEDTAIKVEKIMKDIYDSTGLTYYTYVTTINNEGIKDEPVIRSLANEANPNTLRLIRNALPQY